MNYLVYILGCDVMWCDVMWCDVMWCDVMWCGNIYVYSKNNVFIVIFNFKVINEKMISLFYQFKIRGIKYLYFENFCKVAEIVKRGNYLTLEGL